MMTVSDQSVSFESVRAMGYVIALASEISCRLQTRILRGCLSDRRQIRSLAKRNYQQWIRQQHIDERHNPGNTDELPNQERVGAASNRQLAARPPVSNRRISPINVFTSLVSFRRRWIPVA